MSEKESRNKFLPIPYGLKFFFFNLFEGLILLALIVIFFIILSPIVPSNRIMQTYIVSSGSMEPSIHVGSIALVRRVDFNILKKGDVIAFIDPLNTKRIILHRIYAVNKSDKNILFLTKGDNNKGPDFWKVLPAVIKGRMIFSLPYLGYLGAFVKKPLGFSTVIIIPSILLILLQIRKIKEGIEEEIVKRTNETLNNLNRTKLLLILILSIGIISLMPFISNNNSFIYALFSKKVTANNISFSVGVINNKHKGNKHDHDTDNEKGQHHDEHDFHFEKHDGKYFKFHFAFLDKYKKIKYLLSYDSDDGHEGVQGESSLEGKSDFDSPEITFGTCSKDDCRFEKNIKNIKLSIVFEDKMGKFKHFEKDIN